VGEEIRRLLLHIRTLSDDLDPKADALLFAAGRAQHVARRILPALQRGEWVVCARYLDSSMAYQGGGYGLDMDALRELQGFATGGLKPDLTILLDVPVEIGLGRKRRDRWNRFEDTESAVFFERVRRTYLGLAAAEPDRYRVLDASGSVDETDAAIRELVAPLLP
jgi:dTMP kinase